MAIFCNQVLLILLTVNAVVGVAYLLSGLLGGMSDD